MPYSVSYTLCWERWRGLEVYGEGGGVGRGHLNRGREETNIMRIGLTCMYII